MITIETVLVESQVDQYIRKHQLLSQFRKSVQKLKSGQHAGLDFKKRIPKSANIWQFRITQKYRAWCKKKKGVVIIYKIDDHQ